jgi:alcohol dehydrogenase
LISGQRRLRREQAEIHHVLGVAAFAEHAVVSRNSCIKVETEIDPVEAALFGCAVLTGVGAAVNTAKVQPGTSVAVVGLGGVGLCTVLGALAAGAREVIAVDVHDSKLRIAKALGASATVNARDADAVEQVRLLTHGGVDTAFEMAGPPQALDAAYRMTRRGGLTVTASLPHPDKKWPIQQISLVVEERTVKGSYLGSCVPRRDLPRYMALYKAGKLPVNKLMGRRIALDDINEGFDRLASGEGLRDVIVF